MMAWWQGQGQRKLDDMESMTMWHVWWGCKDTWLCPGAIIKPMLKPDIILEEELQVSQNFGIWLSMEKWVRSTVREHPPSLRIWLTFPCHDTML